MIHQVPIVALQPALSFFSYSRIFCRISVPPYSCEETKTCC